MYLTQNYVNKRVSAYALTSNESQLLLNHPDQHEPHAALLHRNSDGLYIIKAAYEIIFLVY